jgi:hypothetical protein
VFDLNVLLADSDKSGGGIPEEEEIEEEPSDLMSEEDETEEDPNSFMSKVEETEESRMNIEMEQDVDGVCENTYQVTEIPEYLISEEEKSLMKRELCQGKRCSSW